MENLEKELLSLKKKIEKAEVEKNKADGLLEALEKSLENDFGCKNIEQAQNHLELMKKQINKKEKKLEAKLFQLKEKYDW